MKELSLNILDIAKNSTKAGATLVRITIDEADGWRTLTIADNGCGMSPEFLAQVTDPFTTTRTTRKVGMGLPLLKLAAEQAEGSLTIRSSQTPPSGTTVTARFRMDHLDCVPVGDYAGTMVTLIQGSPDIDFSFCYRRASGTIELETAQMREILGGIPLDMPEVLSWVYDSLQAPE
jgi:anti-sigma regulatory factor (Ser/Thr protein kinase)